VSRHDGWRRTDGSFSQVSKNCGYSADNPCGTGALWHSFEKHADMAEATSAIGMGRDHDAAVAIQDLVHTSQSRVDVANKEIVAAEAKVDAAWQDVAAAEAKVDAAIVAGDPYRISIAKAVMQSALQGLDTAQSRLDTAVRGLDSAQTQLDHAVSMLIRVEAIPGSSACR
jgi:hypothetical protein